VILDGYNRRAVISVGSADVRMIYRPLLAANAGDRKRWRWEISWLDEETSQRAIDEFHNKQIVSWGLDGVYPNGMRFIRERHPGAYGHVLNLLYGTVVDASGDVWREVEGPWAKNLREGVILDLTAPEIARRSCADCQKFWYLSSGEVQIRNSTGEKELRPEFALPSCRTEFGCPKGTPENQRSLNTANGWAWRHFKLCDASGVFPCDAIVQSNARIIRSAIKEVEARQKQRAKQ